jgi:hypothetical protein
MPTVFATVVRYCAVCGEEADFTQPECVDGHEPCPEWFCMRCGDAMLVGFDPQRAGSRRRRTTGAA